MDPLYLEGYARQLEKAIGNSEYYGEGGIALEKEMARQEIARYLSETKAYGKKIFFIGNGGSASIASHMSEDFSKMAGIRALCFSDAPFLTCLANDYSYAEVFEKALEIHADEGDMLFAISSSGKSPNIINGVGAARRKNMKTVTLSGFQLGNPLSRLGDINIHTPSASYGIIESAHSVIIHYFLDFASGKLMDALKTT